MSESNSVGTGLKVNNKAVGGLTSIDGVSISGDEIEVTDLGNSTGYRDYLQGFKDGGEVTLSGFLDGADEGQSEIYSLLDSGSTTTVLIIFPAAIGKTWTLTAFVKEFTTGVDVDNAITFDVTLRVSGKPVLAASTSV